MTISWIPHRFVGGVLALDTANTVVLRIDPSRRFDRFADVVEIGRFAEAASTFRAAELGGRPLQVSDAGGVASLVVSIREAVDRLFRNAVRERAIDSRDLQALLTACAAGLASTHERIGAEARPFGDPAAPIAFEAALAVSALSLLQTGMLERLKLCPNCGWLFLDRSRNASRLWCDMSVCGNRRKASRHYRRRQAQKEMDDGWL